MERSFFSGEHARLGCPGWRLAKPFFRRDAENHTQEGDGHRKNALCTRIKMRLP